MMLFNDKVICECVWRGAGIGLSLPGVEEILLTISLRMVTIYIFEAFKGSAESASA